MAPRTECCCQPVKDMSVVIDAPLAGRIAATITSSFDPATFPAPRCIAWRLAPLADFLAEADLLGPDLVFGDIVLAPWPTLRRHESKPRKIGAKGALK